MEYRDSLITKAVIFASNKGYRVTDDGEVISHKGTKRKLSLHSGKNNGRKQYYKFNITDSRGVSMPVPVHQLQAFQIFGMAAFEKGKQIRHKDGDGLNNSSSNIEMGTPIENIMDRTKESRVAHALKAAEYTRVLNKEQVSQLIKLRKEGLTYDELSNKFGIASSTAHKIVKEGGYKS